MPSDVALTLKRFWALLRAWTADADHPEALRDLALAELKEGRE